MTPPSTTLEEPDTTTHAWSAADPQAPKQGFYYGWVMAPVAMLAQICTSPGQTFGMSFFKSSICASLALSEKQFSAAYMLGTLLACLPLTFFGKTMDRYGIRWTMTGVVLMLGFACLFTSQVSGLATLFIAFLLLRMMGQGALTLCASNTVSMWFHARLGTVTGLLSVGMASAMAVVPMIVLSLIESIGWRWTYVAIGLLIWAVMLPILAFVYRNRPEDIGQLIDGESHFADEATRARRARHFTRDFTLEQAIRTRAFWIVMAMFCGWALIITGLVFHITNVFDVRGRTATDAAIAFGGFAAAMAAMQLIGGALADRLPMNLLLSIGMAGMAAGIALLLGGVADWTYIAYALLGGSQGLLGSAGTPLWARYYGRAHLGRIRGVVMSVTVAGSAVGPYLMGIEFDAFGSYTRCLCGFLATFVLLSIATLFATRPRDPDSDTPEIAAA